MLDAGYWILDAGCWMLDICRSEDPAETGTGCWIIEVYCENTLNREHRQAVPCSVREAFSLDPRGEDAAHTEQGIFMCGGD